jgi:hypothetical protein
MEEPLASPVRARPRHSFSSAWYLRTRSAVLDLDVLPVLPGSPDGDQERVEAPDADEEEVPPVAGTGETFEVRRRRWAVPRPVPPHEAHCADQASDPQFRRQPGERLRVPGLFARLGGRELRLAPSQYQGLQSPSNPASAETRMLQQPPRTGRPDRAGRTIFHSLAGRPLSSLAACWGARRGSSRPGRGPRPLRRRALGQPRGAGARARRHRRAEPGPRTTP